MGNRAVITTPKKDIGVYLHWNGSRNNIESFLAYCDMKGYRPPEIDEYGWARLCQVIGNTIGGTLSVGIGRYENQDKDNGDNGVYVIKDWDIVGREYYPYNEEHVDDILGALEYINLSMPANEQVTAEQLIDYSNKWIIKHQDYFKDKNIDYYNGNNIESLEQAGTLSEKSLNEMFRNLEDEINNYSKKTNYKDTFKNKQER